LPFPFCPHANHPVLTLKEKTTEVLTVGQTSD